MSNRSKIRFKLKIYRAVGASLCLDEEAERVTGAFGRFTVIVRALPLQSQPGRTCCKNTASKSVSNEIILRHLQTCC